jgi:hypothetical protein
MLDSSLSDRLGFPQLGSPIEPRSTVDPADVQEKGRLCGPFRGVSDRTRTGDRLDHNQELYQLSYAHRARSNLA